MMNNRVGTVLIAAFISSIISGVLWAKMLSISTTLAGISSITVGIIVGLSVLLTGRTRKTRQSPQISGVVSAEVRAAVRLVSEMNTCFK